jgi:hypothetical protein
LLWINFVAVNEKAKDRQLRRFARLGEAIFQPVAIKDLTPRTALRGGRHCLRKKSSKILAAVFE